MANKSTKLSLATSQNGIPILFLLIAISTQLAVAMPGKDTKPSDSISFTSSDNDWSRDLDNVKPFAPSANAANMDSEIGRLDYKTWLALFSFQSQENSRYSPIWRTVIFDQISGSQPTSQ